MLAGSPRAWLLASAGVPIAALAILLAGEMPRGLPERTLRASQQLQANLLVLEASISVVVFPLAAIALVRRDPVIRPGRLHALRCTAQRLLGIVTAFVATSAALSLALSGTSPEAVQLITGAHLALFMTTLALGALGAWCGAAFRDPLDASGCSIAAAVAIAGSVFAFGPLLEDVPAPAIGTALLVNPIVVTAATAHLDIFRSGALYRLSPIAHLGVNYPDLRMAVALFASVAFLMLLAAATLLSNASLAAFEGERNTV